MAQFFMARSMPGVSGSPAGQVTNQASTSDIVAPSGHNGSVRQV